MFLTFRGRGVILSFSVYSIFSVCKIFLLLLSPKFVTNLKCDCYRDLMILKDSQWWQPLQQSQRGESSTNHQVNFFLKIFWSLWWWQRRIQRSVLMILFVANYTNLRSMPKLNKASRGKASSLATLVAEVDLNPKKKKCEFSCLILVLNFLLSSFAHTTKGWGWEKHSSGKKKRSQSIQVCLKDNRKG